MYFHYTWALFFDCGKHFYSYVKECTKCKFVFAFHWLLVVTSESRQIRVGVYVCCHYNWSFQKVFALDFGHFQYSNTQ